jgi:hypothetical protein
MAITQVNVSTPTNEILFTETNLGNIVDAVKATSTKVYWIQIDNSANVAASYFKAWNATSGSITVGTTVPDLVILVPASSIISFPFFTAAVPGVTFATAFSIACLTTGGTAGTTSPASAVSCTVSYV